MSSVCMRWRHSGVQSAGGGTASIDTCVVRAERGRTGVAEGREQQLEGEGDGPH